MYGSFFFLAARSFHGVFTVCKFFTAICMFSAKKASKKSALKILSPVAAFSVNSLTSLVIYKDFLKHS